MIVAERVDEPVEGASGPERSRLAVASAELEVLS